VFFHSPLSFVKTILDGMTDTGKAFEIRRIKSEKRRIGRRFDYKYK